MKNRSHLFLHSAWLLILSSGLLWGQMRIIPHVTPASGAFATRIILTNPTDADQNYRFTPYAVDGNLLSVVTGSLAAGETRVLNTSELFGGEAVSHFTADENTETGITIAYQVADGSNSPAHVGATEQSMRWRIYPGTQDDVLDGLAVVNMGGETVEVFARQVDYDNQELNRASIGMVNSSAKALYLFGDFVRTADSYYEIFADAPLALTALRFANGIPGARFFWETNAVSLPPLVETPTDPRVGQTATFAPNAVYNLQGGKATIVDERTIRIDNFTYDGSGPDVRFYLGLNGDYINGFPVSGVISGGAPFVNASLTLTLPEDRTLDDFNGISVWCTIFLLDFSSDMFK